MQAVIFCEVSIWLIFWLEVETTLPAIYILYICCFFSRHFLTRMPMGEMLIFLTSPWECLPLTNITKGMMGIFCPALLGWVGLWGFLWWAPSAKRKDHHGVSSGWSSVWYRSITGLSSTQYEQIPIILGVWPFWLTPVCFRSITFGWAYG